MSTVGTAIWQVVVGIIALAVIWYVFDSVHERNTEIILAAMGVVYTQLVATARRQRSFVVISLYFFGRLWARMGDEPYDEAAATRSIKTIARLGNLEAFFLVLIELLCLYRLFTSLSGHGWNILSDPLRTFVERLTI